MRPVGLAAAVALLLGPSLALAPSAHAAGSITSPGGGAVFETETAVRLEARVEARSGTTEMRLVDPLGTARTVATAGTSLSAQTLAHVFDTACPEYPGAACAGRQPARNGTWAVQLTGGSSDSRTFVLRVAPRAPAEVRAEATGPREVVVTWRRGAEPDLRGYDVVDGSGRVLAPGDTACPGGTCRTVVTYDADGPSTDVVAVRALRATCPDCDSTVSTTSAEATAQRPGPPSAGPSEGAGSGAPDDGSGGGAPGNGGTGSGGTGTGGTGTDGTGTGGSGTGGSGADGSGGAGGTGTDGTGTASPGGTGGSGSESSGPAGTGGTGTSGTGGATGSGNGSPAPGTGLAPGIPVTTTQAEVDDFALTFRAFGPKIGLPKLPPLPATGVALPAVAPQEDGGFAGELPFGTTTVEERVPSFVAAPAQRIGTAVSAAVDSERLMRSLAAALVLLLVCAHVRRWLAQSSGD